MYTNPHQKRSAFYNAARGLYFALSTEKKFRYHFIALVAVVLLGFLVDLSPLEWIILVLTATTVATVELINTALETLTDLVSPEYHKLARDTKDISAAAVLLISIGAIVAGAILFIPRLIALASG